MLGRTAGWRWSWPLALVAVVDALWIAGGALAVADWSLLGWLLVVYGAVVYAGAAVLRAAPGVAAAGAVAGGVCSLLYDAGTAPHWYPPALVALAWLIYGAGHVWARFPAGRPGAPRLWSPATRQDAWVRAHYVAAVIVGGATALACMVVEEFLRPRAPGALASLVVWWALALMIAVEAHYRRSAAAGYLAQSIAVLGACGSARTWVCATLSGTPSLRGCG